MPVGTVRGRFELDAPALRTLKDLEKQGIRTQTQMKRVADEMDRVGGQQDAQRLREYNQALGELRRNTERTHRTIRTEWVATTRVVRLEVNRQQRAIRELEVSLDRLATKRVSARVSVSGVGPALTRLGALNTGLDAADRGTIRTRVSAPRPPVTGSMRGGGGAAGGAARGGGGLLDFGLAGIRPRNAAMLGALAYAPTLVGGAGAVAGSAGMAALGAGAVGLAGGGALAGGAAGNLLVGKQAVGQIGEARKAMQKYTDAVADFGKASNQARRAKLNLDQAMKAAPRGTRDLIDELDRLRDRWAKLTRPGQEGFMQLLLGGVRAGNRVAPFAAQQVNRVARRTGREGTRFADFLAGPTGRRGMRNMAGAFTENIGNARGAAQGGLGAAVNVMQASRPFLREMTDAIRRWTTGWASSTSNISRTREHIRKMVDHLKSWWNLTRTAGGLLGSLLGAGAGSGQDAVDRLTGQLEEWQRWVDRNPRKVREFFRNAVDSSTKLAGALGRIAEALWNIGRALTPALDRFAQLVTLAGSAGLLTPGVGALAYGAIRGGRGGRGAAGAGGRGGLMGAVAAAGGARGAAGGAGRMAQGTYQVARSVGYGPIRSAGAAAIGLGMGGAPALGKGLGMAARGAGKAAWPIAALMAGLDFAGTPGNFGQRTQAAASGATFGLIPRPVLGTERRDRAGASVDKFLNPLAVGTGATGASIQERMAGIRARLGATTTQGFGGGETGRQRGTRTASAVPEGERKQLNIELGLLRDALKDNTRAQRARLADLSRQRAPGIARDLQAGFRNRNRQPGVSAQEAFGATVSATIGQLGKGRSEGRKEIARNMLSWAREQARQNPKLMKEYEKLARGVKRRFERMGKDIQIVNGQILTGSRSEWAGIADAISSQARRGVSETSREFARLKAQAIGSLTSMGYSRKEAQDLFKFMGKGGVTAQRARATAKAAAANPGAAAATPSFKAVPGDRGKGDGFGRIGGPAPEDRVGRAGAQAQAAAGATAAGGSSGGGLMGANPNLQPYADIGRSMGLQVTSGLRPGSITSSGNVSWHSSGHALDISGSKPNMLRFFNYMKENYGPGLEELIHTPGGVGIKNGQPFTYGGQVAADHFDHVHVADKDPKGVSGAVPGGVPGMGAPGGISLKARQSGLGGVPGALSTRAMGGMAAGMEQAVNAALGGAAPGGAPGGAVGPGRGGKYDMSSLASLWIAAGGPPGVANLMASIAMAESGGNPGIGNAGRTPNGTTVAAGLWQILGLPFPGDPTDPMTNAKMAVAKYNAAGGTAPWNASKAQWGRRAAFAAGGAAGDGLGRFTGDGPGANGHTRTVRSAPRSPRARRAHMGGSGSGLVNVNFHGDFTVRADADIDRIAERVGQKVLGALRGGTPDRSLT